MRKIPVWTVIVCGFALLVYQLPGLAACLIFDRSTIIGGEYWRLMTGHWVHFSDEHLIYNIAVLAITGASIELRRYGQFVLLVLSAAGLIGIALLLFEPDMARFGGLSGIATAALVYLVLYGIDDPSWRDPSLFVLAILVLKLVFEFVMGVSAISDTSEGTYRLVPLSHLSGAIAAVLLFVGSKIVSRRGSKTG